MTRPTIPPILNIILRVAIDTERHLEIVNPGYPVHRCDVAMAVGTFYAGLDVALVREVYEVGKIVDFYPGYGFPTLPIAGHFLNLRFVGCHRFVTAHALLDAGNAC